MRVVREHGAARGVGAHRPLVRTLTARRAGSDPSSSAAGGRPPRGHAGERRDGRPAASSPLGREVGLSSSRSQFPDKPRRTSPSTPPRTRRPRGARARRPGGRTRPAAPASRRSRRGPRAEPIVHPAQRLVPRRRDRGPGTVDADRADEPVVVEGPLAEQPESRPFACFSARSIWNAAAARRTPARTTGRRRRGRHVRDAEAIRRISTGVSSPGAVQLALEQGNAAAAAAARARRGSPPSERQPIDGSADADVAEPALVHARVHPAGDDELAVRPARRCGRRRTRAPRPRPRRWRGGARP